MGGKDRRSELEAVDDCVESAFQHLCEDLSSRSLLFEGFLVVVDELLLRNHSVNSFELLFLFELKSIVGFLAAARPMHSRRVLFVDERVSCASENVSSKTTGNAIAWSSIASHVLIPLVFF